MAKNIELKLDISNIGPHKNLTSTQVIESCRIGIFARNGSGKTFISKNFRLQSKKNKTIDDAKKLLSIDEKKGSFCFSIKSQNFNHSLKIDLDDSSAPKLTDDNNYIYHVFNSDYIKENLEVVSYKPKDTATGYIMGKVNIDITKETALRTLKSTEYNKIEAKIKEEIEKAKEDLRTLGVKTNTKEFSFINFEYIKDQNNNISNEQQSFDELKTKLKKLNSIPDTLNDIKNFSIVTINQTKIEEIEELLKTAINRSSISDEFKTKIKSKSDFVNMGLSLISDNNSCPFCEQDFSESAIKLIDQYEKYINDEENKIRNKIDDCIKYLRSGKVNFSESHTQYLNSKLDYSQIKEFIPSLESYLLKDFIDINDIDSVLDDIIYELESKKENLDSVTAINSSLFSRLNELIEQINEIFTSNEEIIAKANSSKNDIKTEKLELNRKLCRAKLTILCNQELVNFQTLKSLENEISQINTEIKTKQQTQKIDKKEIVIKTFKSYLNKFFKDKYSFNDTEFCLSFNNSLLKSNATDVLSDGEKSIVAFCFFLAETHTLINTQDDYNKLFFIIDDPISSLDFHYVYSIAQIIKRINSEFKSDTQGTNRSKYLILTHNMEFFSILIRNKIIDNYFSLTNGSLLVSQKELITPYEEHLKDIYNISIGIASPNHTTPNSIRHILESINRFHDPTASLYDFCYNITGFEEKEYLYALMQDWSHGVIRNEQSYTTEMIKDSCIFIINYVEQNFSGQIKTLK